MFNPLIRAPVTEEVLEQVKSFIASGKAKVGEKLPTEIQLSSMLGVSRNTVREVFVTLQAQGYIEIKRGKGAYVIDNSDFYERTFLVWFQKNEFKIQELLEVRMTLEPYTAFLAAFKITDDEISELERIQENYLKAVESGVVADMVAYDENFHYKITQASRNEVLDFLHSNVNPALHDYRMNVFSPPANPLTSMPAHVKIIEALKERDSQKAYDAMMNHIQGAKADVVGVANKIVSNPKISCITIP